MIFSLCHGVADVQSAFNFFNSLLFVVNGHKPRERTVFLPLGSRECCSESLQEFSPHVLLLGQIILFGPDKILFPYFLHF